MKFAFAAGQSMADGGCTLGCGNIGSCAGLARDDGRGDADPRPTSIRVAYPASLLLFTTIHNLVVTTPATALTIIASREDAPILILLNDESSETFCWYVPRDSCRPCPSEDALLRPSSSGLCRPALPRRQSRSRTEPDSSVQAKRQGSSLCHVCYPYGSFSISRAAGEPALPA